MARAGPPPTPDRRRAITAGALALLVMLAVWPVLRAGYPALGDGLIHYYRLVQFDHLLRQGLWFPRWAADLGYGYGLPVFNYYPPLTYYLGALFHALGLSFALSLQAVYALAWTLAITGAYALARQRASWAAAIIAAAAYGLAPYLYFNALARGALPETLGLGLLPWVLWGFQRLGHPGGRIAGGSPLFAAVLLAALLLTHLLTAVLALPLILLFALMPGYGPPADRPQPTQGDKPPSPASNFRHLALPVLIGFGLAAYFFLPAVLETGYIQIQRLTGPSDLDFRNNFLTPAELFAWPRPFDPRLVYHVVPPSLSLAALGLALLGLLGTIWRRQRPARWQAALWSTLCLFALLILPVTRPLWEWLALAAVIQFPWRLAGPASLLLALAAGTPCFNPPSRLGKGVRALGPPLALLALWLFSLTWSYAPAFAAPPAPPTPAGLAEYERLTGQLGTTATGEFLPADVRELPSAGGLVSAYAQAQVILRLNAPPPGVTVQRQSATVLSAEAQVSAAAPAVLTFDFFYFPGWRATVDGQPVSITPSHPHGFITVPVPAGDHTLRVRFGPTPLRVVAAAISWLTLAAVVAFAVHQANRKQQPAAGGRQPTEDGQRQSQVPTSQSRFILITLLALLLLRLSFIDGRESVFARTRFDGAAVAGVDVPLDVNFDDQLVLLGYDAQGLTMPARSALPVMLYWRAQNVPAADYSTTVQVLDADGNIWGQADSQHPGRLPTSRWRTDQYAVDTHNLQLLPGAPPGAYGVFVGVYQVDGPALSVLDGERVPRGQLYRLGTLTVTRQASQQRWSSGDALPLSHALGPLTAWAPSPGAGFTNQRAVQAGEAIELTVIWEAKGAVRPDVTAQWELVDASGSVLAALSAPPAHTGYPTSAWGEGEIVRGVYRLRVPATALASPASVRLSLLDAATGTALGGLVEVTTVQITVPERTFTAPPIEQQLTAPIGNSVVLLGYDLDSSGGTITLYWQAAALLDESYTVFVHALAPDGALLAQVDQLPAAGRRPTTGWLPGEVIADAYTLPLAGAAAIRIGLYDPRSGERLGETLMPIP